MHLYYIYSGTLQISMYQAMQVVHMSAVRAIVISMYCCSSCTCMIHTSDLYSVVCPVQLQLQCYTHQLQYGNQYTKDTYT
jgi:hypothetical protein